MNKQKKQKRLSVLMNLGVTAWKKCSFSVFQYTNEYCESSEGRYNAAFY